MADVRFYMANWNYKMAEILHWRVPNFCCTQMPVLPQPSVHPRQGDWMLLSEANGRGEVTVGDKTAP